VFCFSGGFPSAFVIIIGYYDIEESFKLFEALWYNIASLVLEYGRSDCVKMK